MKSTFNSSENFKASPSCCHAIASRLTKEQSLNDSKTLSKFRFCHHFLWLFYPET